MTLNEYQKRAMTTCTPNSKNFSYMFLNLVGEVGEFASKVAKWLRKGKAEVMENSLCGCHHVTEKHRDEDLTDDEVLELRKEAGDILWQLSGLCSVMGWSLEEVAQENLDKLADRQKRDVIVGEGDNR